MRMRVGAGFLVVACLAAGCANSVELAVSASSPSPIGTPSPGVDHHTAAGDAAIALLGASDAEKTSEPDEAILGARTALYLLSSGYGTEAQARDLLGRLEALATPVGSGLGWGLADPWDAFSDGSVNPRETTYAYTTAQASWAFVEASEALGDDRFLDLAESGVTALTEGMCCWSDGAVSALWYSDQAADRGDDRITPNVSALAIYVAMAVGEDDLSLSLLEFVLSSEGQDYSRDPYQGVAIGDHNWPYSSGGSTPNDLVHLAFIGAGLLASGDPEARAVALEALDEAWAAHFSAGGVPGDSVFTRGSQGWGPPAMLWVLSGIPERSSQAASLATTLLTEYYFSDGSPTGTSRGDLWWAMAFARAADAGVA